MGTIKVFSMRDSEGVGGVHFKLHTNHKPNLFKSRKMRRAETQAPGEYTAPGTSSATPPGEELTWAPKERPDLQPKDRSAQQALPRWWRASGLTPQLAFHSHIMGTTFLQTYHFPLPSYNYQRLQRTLNFTPYIAVQLRKNGRLSTLVLFFVCLRYDALKKKKHHW